jgi:hypothetical protein
MVLFRFAEILLPRSDIGGREGMGSALGGREALALACASSNAEH